MKVTFYGGIALAAIAADKANAFANEDFESDELAQNSVGALAEQVESTQLTQASSEGDADSTNLAAIESEADAHSEGELEAWSDASSESESESESASEGELELESESGSENEEDD